MKVDVSDGIIKLLAKFSASRRLNFAENVLESSTFTATFGKREAENFA